MCPAPCFHGAALSGQRGQLSADKSPHFNDLLKMALLCGFRGIGATGISLALPKSRKPHQPTQRTIAMKFETLMLNSLFVVCAAICVSVLTAMLA